MFVPTAPSKMTTRCRRRSRKECGCLPNVRLACFNSYVFAGTEFRQGMGLVGAEGEPQAFSTRRPVMYLCRTLAIRVW